MKASLLKWLTASFAVVLVSSIVSMMATFVGSEGGDLRDLLVLQLAVLPVSVLVIAWCVAGLVRRFGAADAARAFWRHLPGWLLFSVIMADALVLIAELSFVVLQFHTGEPRLWLEHIPAATAFWSSLALAACYVGFRLETDGTSD